MFKNLSLSSEFCIENSEISSHKLKNMYRVGVRHMQKFRYDKAIDCFGKVSQQKLTRKGDKKLSIIAEARLCYAYLYIKGFGDKNLAIDLLRDMLRFNDQPALPYYCELKGVSALNPVEPTMRH